MTSERRLNGPVLTPLFPPLGKQCLLSSGFVTGRYRASPPPTGVTLSVFDACYSAVAVRNDVTGNKPASHVMQLAINLSRQSASYFWGLS